MTVAYSSRQSGKGFTVGVTRDEKASFEAIHISLKEVKNRINKRKKEFIF